MPTCYNCGGEIEFRYVENQLRPIHIDGRGCSGYSSTQATTRPFAAALSYVNPNAHCPVCDKRVFFYQSPYGGRVFFDDLGWPWPKHPCTDNPRSQQSHVKLRADNVYKQFRNTSNEPLDLYELREIAEENGALHMRFGRIDANASFRVVLPVTRLVELDITKRDLETAPSFVVRTYETERAIEFISGRKKRVDIFTVPRMARST